VVPGTHQVRQAVAFPPNFCFEFDVRSEPIYGTPFHLTLIDENGDELPIRFVVVNYLVGGGGVDVTLPGVTTQRVEGGLAHSIKLVRHGTTFKVYVDGHCATTGVYGDYSQFTGFKLDVSQDLSFSNFIGTTLP